MVFTCKRHPEFYFEDGTTTFSIRDQTGEVLYRLYPGLLGKRSAILKTLFTLPQQMPMSQFTPTPSPQLSTQDHVLPPAAMPALGQEGSCDENPIVLQGILRQDFDYLLAFLTGGYAGEEKWEEFLMSVLKMSAFLELDHGYRFAVDQIERLSSITPSSRLELGRRYHVDQWVEPAFRALMAWPLSSIEHLEAHQMGLEYFWILATTKAAIEEHYWAIAYTEPHLIQGSTCVTRSQCLAVWESEWWNGIARHLLHPETPCRGHELLRILEETNIHGICAPCKEATLSHLKNSEALQHSEALEDIAAAQVMDYQMDEGIRSALRNGLQNGGY